MKICLKNAAQHNGSQQVVVKLQARLPERIHSPIELNCSFNVVSYGNYYLIILDLAGRLTMTCQRCLQAFPYDYCNQIQLAVCNKDSIAETLMESFECIVIEDNEIDLVEIVTDELHLFSEDKHKNIADCDSEIRQWIGNKEEIIPVRLGL